MEKLVLLNDLMLNRSVGETLGECLHDTLLEGIILSLSLLESQVQVVVLALKTSKKTFVSDLELGCLYLDGVIDIEELNIFLIAKIVV